jgi:hypothetical protein
MQFGDVVLNRMVFIMSIMLVSFCHVNILIMYAFDDDY